MPDRVAVVTGGASGIGRTTVEVLSDAGYRLALLDLDGDGAADIAAHLATDALAVATDVADGDQVASAIGAVYSHFGRVDVLVTSAGHSEFIGFLELGEAEWRRMIDVHLTGAYHCCRAAIPAMLDQQFGRIVFVSSSGVMNGGSGRLAHYISAKAGLIGLARALAREFGPHGITANCVAPGPVATPLLERIAPERLEQYVAATPTGRLGEAADVAHAIRYLVSDEASFVTGIVLAVNGGRTMF